MLVLEYYNITLLQKFNSSTHSRTYQYSVVLTNSYRPITVRAQCVRCKKSCTPTKLVSPLAITKEANMRWLQALRVWFLWFSFFGCARGIPRGDLICLFCLVRVLAWTVSTPPPFGALPNHNESE